MRIIISFVVLFLINYSSAEDPILSIKNGQIRGRVGQSLMENSTYYAFKGIPFAQPPLNDLRFAAPKPASPWTGVLNATTDVPMCKQILKSESKEDCLYLNVYTPSLTRSDLPVMVWIYGGAFIIGNSQYTQYGPDNFMDQDVIVVSVNYRLGIFGFYSTEDEVAPGNWGLKDQILALKWVQENIAYFGGDPQRVTIFGQSAGSASISYLLQSEQTKGLYQAAIMQSGSSLCPWALSRHKTDSTFSTGKLLGINNPENSTVLLEKMRQIDANDLTYASLLEELYQMVTKYNPLDGLLFSPSVEPEGPDAVVTKRSYAKLESGEFNQVPTMIGHTSMEFLAFYDPIALIKAYMATIVLKPDQYMPIGMNINNTDTASKIGNLITNFYDLQKLVAEDEDIMKYLSIDQFTRPINKMAKLQSSFAPVYFYKYMYVADAVPSRPIAGVEHAAEIPIIFIYRNAMLKTDRDILTSKRMVTMWSNFAKTLNPTPIEDPLLQNISWTAIDNANHYLDINDDLTIGADPDKIDVEFWDSLFEKYGNPPFDTY